MKILKKFVILSLIIGVGYFVFSEYFEKNVIPSTESPLSSINGVLINITVADTQEERAVGLSGVARLPSSEGMLFIFDKSDYHGIWMKDMDFPIDVIWLNENLIVIDITRSLSPDSFPRIFEPSVPARLALEVNSGFVESFNIRKGHKLKLSPRLLPENLQ